MERSSLLQNYHTYSTDDPSFSWMCISIIILSPPPPPQPTTHFTLLNTIMSNVLLLICLVNTQDSWIFMKVTVWKAGSKAKTKSRKYQGVFEVKSRLKTWHIRGIWSQQLEHKQVPKWGTEPGGLACHTRCKCSMETTRNSVKVKVGTKVMKLVESLIGYILTILVNHKYWSHLSHLTPFSPLFSFACQNCTEGWTPWRNSLITAWCFCHFLN